MLGSRRFALLLLGVLALDASAERPLLRDASEPAVLEGRPQSTTWKAPPDTFFVYGGPGSLLGKFQTVAQAPDAQGWTTDDATYEPSHWQIDTFNSPTGTQALWCGATAEQEPGFLSPPGYGNAWNEVVVFRAPVSDPSQGQTVGLSFVFNHDTEQGFDFLHVEYDSAGSWVESFRIDGNNRDPDTQSFVPLQYPSDVVGESPIVYAGGDYGGSGGEIVIRLRISSDGVRSDQDGLSPTDGAAQIDDILVTTSDTTVFEDFEGPDPFVHWQPQQGAPFAGNFAHLMAGVRTHDACVENETPVLGFVDDGSGPYNPNYYGPGTGGSFSNDCSQVPDCALPVFNYTNGVSGAAEIPVDNSWLSPEIAWDLAGPDDDDPMIRGARLRFSVWRNLPLDNGILFGWEVRGRDSQGSWSDWKNRNFIYFGSTPEWAGFDVEISELLPSDVQAVQIRLSGTDWSEIFGFPGGTATQAPLFDNVALLKHELGGPVLRAGVGDLAQDSFAENGLADVSSQMARDLLDVAIDSGRDATGSDPSIVDGDSLVIEAYSVLPGTTDISNFNALRLHYSLSMNPFFEPAIRGSAPTTEVGTGIHGWDQHEGFVDGQPAADGRLGNPYQIVPNHYAFNLPDADFMYPGDVLEYYFEVEDELGNVSTLPADLTGYDDPSVPYQRTFRMRALPTYSAPDGSQPSILLYHAVGIDEEPSTAHIALAESGRLEGIHYDSYEPNPFVYETGLGSAGAHGASLAQLSGYSCILYDSGDQTTRLLSDGSDANGHDESDDIGLLTAWWNVVGADRAIVHFSDRLASWLSASAAGSVYLADLIHAQWTTPSLPPSLIAEPTGDVTGFASDFVVFGACPQRRSFDGISPSAGALATHSYGPLYPSSPIAGVYHAAVDGGGGLKRSLLFPFGLDAVYGIPGKATPTNPTARSIFLEEVLAVLGGNHVPAPGPPVTAPSASQLRVLPAHPNPFNPTTTLAFDLPTPSHGRVIIYNLRGELVRILADQFFVAGRQRLEWNGLDDRGRVVSSGVYIVRYEIDGISRRQKIALVK